MDKDKKTRRPSAEYVQPWEDAGFKFIRLKRGDKIPVENAWGKHTMNAAEITKWINKGGNYGIVLRESDLILDADARSDGKAKFLRYKRDHELDIDFAEVPMFQTGGFDNKTKSFGRHLLFKKDPATKIVSKDKKYELEWRTFGGVHGRYIVGPGSIHPVSGAMYKPRNDVAPIDAPMMPHACLEELAKTPRAADGSEIIEPGKHTAEELESMLQGLPVEEFNSESTWWEVLCSSHHAVNGSPDGKQVFLDWSAGDISYGSEIQDMNARRWDSLSNGDRESKITVATLYKLLIERDKSKLIPRGDIDADEFPDEWPHEIDYDGLDPATAAKRYLRHRPAPIATIEGEDVYSFDPKEKIWGKVSRLALKNEISATEPCSENLLSEGKIAGMIARIQTDTYTSAMPGEWIRQPEFSPDAADLIPFHNGLLNRKTGKLLPYTSDFFVVARPDYDYEPDAECPVFDKFLDSSLDAEFHSIVEEMLGYCFYGAAPAHVIFVLSGVTRGGKSTLMHVAEELVGKSAATTVAINSFATEFGLSEAPGKKIILVPDPNKMHPGSAAKITDKLKGWAGGDSQQINRKNLPLITIKPTGKIIMGCNEVPRLIDESGALAARYRHIRFVQSFKGREDVDLSAKLSAELPGIANRALAGLERLESNRWRFSIGEKGKEASGEARDTQQLAGRFARDSHLIFTGDHKPKTTDRLPRDQVFAMYRDWCDDENVSMRERQNRSDFVNSLIAASGHKIKLSLLAPNDKEKKWLEENGTESIPSKIRMLVGLRIKKPDSDSDLDL